MSTNNSTPKKPQMRLFVSSGLTNLNESELRQLHNIFTLIEMICDEICVECYFPHKYTDPEKTPDLTPEQIYFANAEAIRQCHGMISIISYPSLGAGIERQLAKTFRIPTLTIREKGKKTSRMALGITDLSFTYYSLDPAEAETEKEELSKSIIEFVLHIIDKYQKSNCPEVLIPITPKFDKI